MSSNVREFSIGLDRFAAAIPEEVKKLHRATALEGLRGVVLMTPVDKGRARGNWQVSQDTPATGETGVLDKQGGATIARGAAEIMKAKAYSVTWLVNALPYIEELENGSSRQAPRGMLAVTANRLRNWLRRQ